MASHAVTPKNSLALNFPDLAKEWSSRNPQTPDKVARGSQLRCWWLCPIRHEYQATPYHRTSKEHGCPYCSGHRTSELNALSCNARYLLSEFSARNAMAFGSLSVGSNTVCWWKCPSDHEWQAAVCDRTTGSGCPYCSGRRVSVANSFVVHFQELARQYHSSLNIQPVTAWSQNSHSKVWWKCELGHEWKASIKNRTRLHQGCPVCAGVCHHSTQELEIFRAVKQQYPDAQNGTRKLLPSRLLELDIWVPSLRKAVEYDGYTHHKSDPAQIERDARKDRECIQAGIKLLRVPDPEYRKDPRATLKKVLDWLAEP